MSSCGAKHPNPLNRVLTRKFPHSTLRHLLTHSIGSGLPFMSEACKKFVRLCLSPPRSLGLPKLNSAFRLVTYRRTSCRTRAREVCRVTSQLTTSLANSRVERASRESRLPAFLSGFLSSIRCSDDRLPCDRYGMGAEWLGVFVTRVSGTSFRRAAQELLYEPLNLPKDTIETYRTPSMNENLAEIVAKLPDGTFISLPEPGFDTPQHADMPPEGQSVLGNAPFWCSLRTYARVLRCLLNKTAPSPGGEPLISEKLWEEATTDDYKRRGISIKQDPFQKTTDPAISNAVEKWSVVAEGQDESLGWNMFQQVVHRSPVRPLIVSNVSCHRSLIDSPTTDRTQSASAPTLSNGQG